jgi:predicted HAD superfamily hydrolase
MIQNVQLASQRSAFKSKKGSNSYSASPNKYLTSRNLERDTIEFKKKITTPLRFKLKLKELDEESVEKTVILGQQIAILEQESANPSYETFR